MPRPPALFALLLLLLPMGPGCGEEAPSAPVDTSPRSSRERSSDPGAGAPEPAPLDLSGAAPPPLGWRVDLDGDGAPQSEDCDDYNRNIHPGAEERCDGVDEDCDGKVDDGAVDGPRYHDADGDGYGGTLSPHCSWAEGFVWEGGDCDDADPEVHPGAEELCGNAQDDDCDRAAECEHAELVLVGEEERAFFYTDDPLEVGWSYTVRQGDYNGDGLIDLAVGSPIGPWRGEVAGRVDIIEAPFLGRHRMPEGARATLGLGFGPRTRDREADDPRRTSFFGGDVEGADLDFDGYADLLVTDLLYDDVGGAFLFYGPFVGEVSAEEVSFTMLSDGSRDIGQLAPRLADLNGDGQVDVYDHAGSGAGFWMYPGPLEGEHLIGYSDPEVWRVDFEKGGRAADTDHDVVVRDMDGDGVNDLVMGQRARNVLWQDLLLWPGPLTGPGTLDLGDSSHRMVWSDEISALIQSTDFADVDGDGYGDAMVLLRLGGETNFTRTLSLYTSAHGGLFNEAYPALVITQEEESVHQLELCDRGSLVELHPEEWWLTCQEYTDAEDGEGITSVSTFWAPTWEHGTYNHREIAHAYTWVDPTIYSYHMDMQGIAAVGADGGRPLGLTYAHFMDDYYPYTGILSIVDLNL